MKSMVETLCVTYQAIIAKKRHPKLAEIGLKWLKMQSIWKVVISGWTLWATNWGNLNAKYHNPVHKYMLHS